MFTENCKICTRAPVRSSLHKWITGSYLRALQRYGPDHALTKSWAAELADIELFAAYLPEKGNIEINCD